MQSPDSDPETVPVVNPARILCGQIICCWLAMTVFLACFASAGAVTLKVALDTPASVIVYDDGTLLRSDSGGFFDVPLTYDINEKKSVALNVIPNDAAFNFPLTIRFRVEGLPTPMPVPDPDDIWWWYGGSSSSPTIVDHDLGEGGEGWYEFVQTIDAVTTPFYNHENRLVFLYSTGITWFTEAYVYLYIHPPHKFVTVEHDDNPLDHWYRLERTIFPDEYIDGSPWPEEFILDSVPVANEMVEIGGTNVRYDPASVLTDSNGEFGVLAFVDPDSFYAKHDQKGLVVEPAKGKGQGSLRLKYKSLIQEQGISGNFCEVIMVEGTVRVVEGTGTVRAGDILVPGQVLSLGASWGQKAQIGLRFVNGSNASIIQDVYTNACLADMIVIGSSGIENTSVIQGNTAIMSVARTLCEKVAGLPSTPEQWATATGRFVVTTAASNAVPGSGIVAFAVRYGVKTAAGKTYDHVVNSGSDGKMLLAVGDGPPRMDLTVFYDGSSRLAHNMTGPILITETGEAASFASVAPGQWQEIIDNSTLGRQWNETLATIDTQGPDLRYSSEYFADANPGWTRLEIRAFDPAGLDPLSLNVVLDGVDKTLSFVQQDATTWRAEFWGGAASLAPVTIHLSDTIGNESILTWSPETRPGPPVIQALSVNHGAGEIHLDWLPPLGMSESDVLYYELQFVGCSVCDTAWRSLGSDSEATILLPSVPPGESLRLAVRACDRSGRTGPAALSSLVPTEPGTTVWLLR